MSGSQFTAALAAANRLKSARVGDLVAPRLADLHLVADCLIALANVGHDPDRFAGLVVDADQWLILTWPDGMTLAQAERVRQEIPASLRGRGRLQAKDIDDHEFLSTVDRLSRDRAWGRDHRWVMRMEVEREFPHAHWKVLLAKGKSLHRRGLLDGCFCTCRGDYELTSAGRAFLAASPSDGAA